MTDSIRERVVVGVVTAVVLGALTLLWNWASSGGLVRVLGGLTEKEIDTKIAEIDARFSSLPQAITEARVLELIESATLGSVNQGQVNTLIERQIQSLPDEVRVNSLIDARLRLQPTGELRDDVIALIAAEIERVPGKGLSRGEVEALVATELAPFEVFRTLKGAVIAFDRSEGVSAISNGACPFGWTRFEPASGRMIVGAGRHGNLDENGNKLTEHPSFLDDHEKDDAIGGSETHTLTIEEMPKHSHRVATEEGKPITFGGFNYQNGVNELHIWHSRGTKSELYLKAEEIKPDTPTLPHNNMPPYIALYFCKKEG